jgi:7-carboxy-7-deazaguanine synthase
MYQINEQQPVRRDHDSEGFLQVHSTFHTIQGEGPYAGRAAFFIRLFGCNLQCPGCDTDYTSRLRMYSPEHLLEHVRDAGRDTPGDLIVITGGEPLRQNIGPFVRLLLDAGLLVQIESNGTVYLPDFPYDRVTLIVSPKTARINPRLAQLATAFKYVLEAGAVSDDGLPTTALANTAGLGKLTRVARPPADWHGPIYLQPMDAKDEDVNKRNAQACAESVLTHRKYILGFQIHKYLELP